MVTALVRTLIDVARQLARPSGRAAWRADLAVLPRALRWALPWAILGRTSGNASPLRWLERWAKRRPRVVVVADATRKITFAELFAECRQRGAGFAAQGVRTGDRVAVLLPTSVELVVTLFACWSIGAVPCPLDPETPTTILDELLARLEASWWIGTLASGADTKSSPMLLDSAGCTPIDPVVRIAATDVALILPTSGSEGSVKLCKITAGRLALSGHALGALGLDCRSGDVVYCPLPLHHATGTTVALMPALVHGVTLRLAGKFSASRFWDDVHDCGATHLVYVGDLLRMALAASSISPCPPGRLRRAIGNGLDESTWRTLAARLPALQVVEFYGATEAPSVLLNFCGRVGSIGRVPGRWLSRYVVVREENCGEPNRWTHCAPGEVGELWIRIPRGKRPWLGDFEGYLTTADDCGAIIENVFRRGDRYYRTHDLVRYDADDFLYFVDRTGDVWRNKGHNVSTLWLADELRAVGGIVDACVVPVALDDSPRRFGLAVVVTSPSDWREAFTAKLRSLPSYARPHLVQVAREVPRTATHKPNKAMWRARRWEPSDDGEAYVWREGLERVAPHHWDQIRSSLFA